MNSRASLEKWASLRFLVNGKVYSGIDGLLKWEEAKKEKNSIFEYIELKEQHSAMIVEITAL